MGRLTLCAAVLLCASALDCSAKAPPTGGNEAELAIYEVVLRGLPEHYHTPLTTIYLKLDKLSDPPDSFLARLADLKCHFKKGSRAFLSKERPDDRLDDRIRDRETMEKGTSTTLKILRMDGDTADVSVSNYRGPLNADGYDCHLKKINGRWQIVDKGERWVS